MCISVYRYIVVWVGEQILRYIFYVQFKNSISFIGHTLFTQWWFKAPNRTYSVYILQDILSCSHANILKGFLTMHCSINWNVQLVSGCYTCVMVMNICNFYKHILRSSGSISFSYLYIQKLTAYIYNFFIVNISNSLYKESDEVLGTPAIILIILLLKTCVFCRCVWYTFPQICKQ